MQTRNRVLTKNQFKASQQQDFKPYDESIVFISYKRDPDLPIARDCAEKLEDVSEITYWLDEEDECLAKAQSRVSKTDNAIETAKCIEKGLDVASALLGIIGPKTFDSPWVPYEIGGVRGRQRFSITRSTTTTDAHPLIAHLIYNIDIEDVPDFVALSTPLFSFEEVVPRANSVADILQEVDKNRYRKISLQGRRDIRSYHGVEKIYERNISRLRYR